jgi:hypothetical protein
MACLGVSHLSIHFARNYLDFFTHRLVYILNRHVRLWQVNRRVVQARWSPDVNQLQLARGLKDGRVQPPTFSVSDQAIPCFGLLERM